jgi:Raf kinase inhibitor-like YbhB/YbcL family protein
VRVRRSASVAVLAAALAVGALAACSNDGRTLSPPGPDQTLSIITTSSSPSTSAPASTSEVSGSTVVTTNGSGALGLGTQVIEPGASAQLRMSVPWADGGEIAARFTCAGEDVSPSITWTGVPSDAVELALLFTDLDSDPPGFVHWLVAGLDPASTGIAEGRVPTGAAQALNGFGDTGYRGPCPPESTHTYLVTLYALRERSGIKDGDASGDDLLTSLESRAIGSTAVSGTVTASGGLGGANVPATTAAASATTPIAPDTTQPGTITITRP